MDTVTTLLYIIVFLYGITVGSFLNVCILRIPKGESVVTVPSHCPSCEKRLKWFELIPIFSFLFLGGRCTGCKSRISAQYPLIEAANGFLWVLALHLRGLGIDAALCAFLSSALLTLSVIDARTREIPPGTTITILVLGCIRTLLNLPNWTDHVIGFFAISGLLFLVLLVSSGRGMGGGDVKLMAVCGLFIGWQNIILAFLLACVLGSLIHLTLMALKKAGRVLALGPYLAAGVLIALYWGQSIIDWYLALIL